jgi:N-acetylneuraminate synthase
MTIRIGGARVGDGEPCFVIAEAGVNHNGDLGLAKDLADAAREAGASAVKFQSFQAALLATEGAPKAGYQSRATGHQGSQLEMLRALQLDEDAHRALIDHCRAVGVTFLSSAFDAQSADLLERLDVPCFKLGSGELTNLPLLRHVARKGRPMILSTGMSRLGEVEDAVLAIEAEGLRQIVLLHCVSNYPADPGEANLRAMDTLRAAFGYPVGYSDHTLGDEVSLAAVARGACALERHFTLDRTLPGPDHQASLEPEELARWIASVRKVEAALGDGRKAPALGEAATAAAARRSLVAARDVPAGKPLAWDDLTLLRPGTGLPPALLEWVLGRALRRELRRGDLLRLEDLA